MMKGTRRGARKDASVARGARATARGQAQGRARSAAPSPFGSGSGPRSQTRPGQSPGRRARWRRWARLPGPSALVVLFCLAGVIRLALGIDGALAHESPAEVAARPAPSQATTAQDTARDDEEVAALVLDLREREAQLAERSAQIEERLTLLAAAEERVARQIAALREAEAELDATMTLADGLAEADISRLTAMFEAMRPEQAAQVFAEMDPRFAAGLLGRLRPETAAGILGGLEPSQAYALSTILAGRNALVPTRAPAGTE